MWLLRLDEKPLWLPLSFRFFSFWGEFHVLETLRKPYGKVHVVSNWGFLLTASEELRPRESKWILPPQSSLQMMVVPADILLATSWQPLSYSHAAKLLQKTLPYRSWDRTHTCCFQLLSFMVIRYMLKRPTMIVDLSTFSFSFIDCFASCFWSLHFISSLLIVSKASMVHPVWGPLHLPGLDQNAPFQTVHVAGLFFSIRVSSIVIFPETPSPTIASRIDTVLSTTFRYPIALPVFFMEMITICSCIVSSITCLSYSLVPWLECKLHKSRTPVYFITSPSAESGKGPDT